MIRFDVDGQEELENIKVLSYTSTDVFLLCFAVSEPTSFVNVQSKWLPELRKYVTKPVIVLVGTKSDLKDDEAVIQRLASQHQKPITKEQGDAKAKEIGAVGYIECSAIRKTGIKEVFDFAMMTALKPSKKGGGCLLL
jgi:small GTP-binding protein